MRLPDRFWNKVERAGPHECWQWAAGGAQGYGQFRIDGRVQSAHRLAYEELVGPIPPGAELDHLCRNRACVNPAHLEPVTRRENILRGNGACAKHARKTHCDNGHEFTPENTYQRPGRRHCRTCGRARTRAYKQRKKEHA